HLRGLLRASRAGHLRGEKRVDQRRLAGGHVTDDGDPQRLGTLRRSVQQDWLGAEFTPSLKAQAHVGESRGGRALGGGHASVLTRSTRNRWRPDRTRKYPLPTGRTISVLPSNSAPRRASTAP